MSDDLPGCAADDALDTRGVEQKRLRRPVVKPLRVLAHRDVAPPAHVADDVADDFRNLLVGGGN